MSGQRVERMVKLVRSKTGELWQATGIEWRRVEGEEHVELLRQKLIEEAAEYMANPSVGELADVLEVLEALAIVDLQVDREIIENEVNKRFRERGGYVHGMTMWMTGELNEGKVPDPQSKVIAPCPEHKPGAVSMVCMRDEGHTGPHIWVSREKVGR